MNSESESEGGKGVWGVGLLRKFGTKTKNCNDYLCGRVRWKRPKSRQISKIFFSNDFYFLFHLEWHVDAANISSQVHHWMAIKKIIFHIFLLWFTFQKYFSICFKIWSESNVYPQQQNRKFIKSGRSWNPLESLNRFRLASVSRLPSRAIWPRATFPSILFTKNNSKLLLVVWLCDRRDFHDFSRDFHVKLWSVGKRNSPACAVPALHTQTHARNKRNYHSADDKIMPDEKENYQKPRRSGLKRNKSAERYLSSFITTPTWL